MRYCPERGTWVFVALLLLLPLSGCGGGGDSGPTFHNPTAVAGNAQSAFKGALVTLDGSGSHDVDGNPITYTWTQTAGAAATLSSSSSAKPTFTAPAVSGALGFSLVVSNAQYSSQPSTVAIMVQDRAPVAVAPAALTVTGGSQVVLDGSASSDPDHDALTYTWTQVSGVAVSLTPGTSGRSSFIAPNVAATLSFSLRVNDGEQSSAAVMETVTIVPGPPVPPIVSAGADVTSPKRAPVLLHASISYASGGPITFSWQQTSGPSVTLQNANTADLSFTTPAAEGDLGFAVTASDVGGTSAPSNVTVHVRNFAPLVSGLSLQPVNPGRNDPISVSASISDPDTDPLTVTYAWTRNGTALPQATGSSYPLGNQKKGDVIAVTITASDGQKSTSVSGSVMIADTPAMLTGTAPTTAPYGVPLSFNVTASDVDGDPTGPIELDYGPAGMSVTSTGTVSWTPGGPMFDRTVDVNWGVRLKNTPAIKLHGTITVSDASRKLPLMRSNSGIPVGNNSIDVQDFDGNGSKEVLVGTYESIYLLAQSGSGYAQTWVYPFQTAVNSTIAAVTSGDTNGDGHREIFFSAGPIVVKLDGVTRRELGRFGSATPNGSNPAGPYCVGLRYADVDGDGKGDLVCLGLDSNGYGSNGRIYVIDPATMQLKWQTADPALGTSLAVGNVDTDPDVEIIANNGYVFDGKTQQNKWAYGPGFGSAVDIGDVSGDGVAKIVGLIPGGPARVFDAVAKSPVWEIPGGIVGFSALKVADLDGAKPAEIIVGDQQWGNVTAYRYDATSKTANIIAQLNSQGDGVSAIGVGDVNADGKAELVWGSDYYSSGRDFLVVASWTPAASVLWSGPTPAQLDGAFYGAKLAHVSATSTQLMFMTPSTDSGYAGTRVIALDPASGAVGVSGEVDSNWSHDFAFDVGNVTGGTLDSMLIGTATLYTDYFTAYDYASSTKTWSSNTTTGGGVALAHADLNNDGIADVVGITSGGYIYAFDVAHQKLLWSSTGIGGGADVAVADLDGDGVPEIIALANSQLIIYAGSGSSYMQKALYPISGTGLLVADTDGDGVPEIYVLSGTTVSRFDNKLTPLNAFQVPAATSLYLEQSAFGRKNLLLATGNDLNGQPSSLIAVDPATGQQIWAAPPLVGTVPIHSLGFYDLMGTGTLQIAFGTTIGMYVTQ